MKTFLIAGAIVATDAERETFEDVTPTQFNAFLTSLESGEEIHLDITYFSKVSFIIYYYVLLCIYFYFNLIMSWI